jgi:hypothetical protein
LRLWYSSESFGGTDVADSDGSFGCLVVLVIVIGGPIVAFSHDKWSNALWYSFEYGVAFNDVQTDTKPTDCDFLHAPLGLKDCTYTPHVKVFNGEGFLVGGENAPSYGSDTKTGKPIISYDGGKSWNWNEGATTPNPKPKTVRVLWIRE